MNKQKLKNRQQSSKSKKIRKKESEDSDGIRRRKKGDKPELDINIFYIIKAGLLVGMLFSYFIFSTALLPLFLGYASLYYFSFWVERKINRSYNSENKKRLFKMDAALAFITIIVSISTAIFSFSTMVGNRAKSFSTYFYRIMSLSTGVRNSGSKQYGIGERPQGFTKPEGGGSGGMNSGQRPPKPDFDLNDLPIEFAFNQILSSVIQFLIFGVIIIGSITVLWYFYNKYIRIKKLNIKQNDKNDWSFSKEDLIKLLEEEM